MSQMSSAMSLCSEKLTLWILVEGSPGPMKFSVEWNDSPPDLYDLACKLCKEEDTFENIKPKFLEFFNHEDRTNPLQADTLVTNLNTTAASPLVVRYPFSSSEVIVRCNLSVSWFKSRFPHTSGLWCLLCHEAETNFETLRAGNPSYFFIYKEDKKKSGEEQVKNEFALNKIVEKIKPNESGECEISLSIRIQGKKAYGEWEISEVFEKFLHKSGSSLGDINQFDIEEFTQPDPEISDDIVNSFIGELKRKKKTFIHVNRNESTCREFISAFMTAAVEHVQLKESKLCLKSEEWLDGSRGFGPVDYSVHLEDFVLLVCEAKKEDFEKGAAQNIVQMHSAVEKINKKRKIDEIDTEPQVQIYGIVTNALGWYFLKWIGSPENPQLDASGPHVCKFDGDDMTDAKKITNYIASILQMQVSGLGSNKKICLETQETTKSTEGSG